MNIYNIALINVIATILLALLTVVAFIGREPLKSIPLPEKIFPVCKKCHSDYNTFLTRKIKIPTFSKSLFKFNIITISLIFVINIIYFMQIPDEIIKLISSNSLATEAEVKIMDAFMLYISIVAELILMIINILLYIIFAYKKTDTIICICNTCGAIEESNYIQEDKYEKKIF